MKDFNWALFIGCCLIALALLDAGIRISNRMPQTMHGNFHGSLTSGHVSESREFLSEWDAAAFLLMGYDEFNTLLPSGELSGTYATFQVERRVWRLTEEVVSPSVQDPSMPTPMPVEYDIVIGDHRVFSRERLTEWLNNRIALAR